MGELARTQLRAPGLDQMGELARGVVAVTLVAPVETDLVGEVVGEIVAEGGAGAVLVGQADQAPEIRRPAPS